MRTSTQTVWFAIWALMPFSTDAQDLRRQSDPKIPLPENPRPDFERAEWLNLNGRWQFTFDPHDEGERKGWVQHGLPDTRSIIVPFSWGSALSGVADSADIGWYSRTISVPESWRGRRVFVVFGASDWHTTVWFDGKRLGAHQGGYTPFSFELTSSVGHGLDKRLVVRVDDTPHPFKLEGKQGYGKARGIWQTVYLEARGSSPLSSVHFTPNEKLDGVSAAVTLLEPARNDLTLRLKFADPSARPVQAYHIRRSQKSIRFEIPVPGARRWTLEDPFLYDVEVSVGGKGLVEDRVKTYFGMRRISIVNLPGTQYPYVALNGNPIYLQMALDQAYHPEGFYTFPTDSILRDEILRARQIGLNGLREHVKIESPRKLYWADKLGILIMADIPNWWGPPDSAAFREHEVALRGMVERDYNHPSIFSWVLFNETWGLYSKVGDRDRYLEPTKHIVVSLYRTAKLLDPTRLVEDNSPCCGLGHTETDLNTWHSYLPGWRWEEHVRMVSDSTFPGSTWNFEYGWRQGGQPMLNSEFGNVWGYEGSTGDVDWSWDYHRAINAFRRYLKLAGWLYTEHHDVVNEWNGYWRYDRSGKETGFGHVVEGMTLRDLHSPFYISVGDSRLSRAVHPGEDLTVPLHASFLTDNSAFDADTLTLIADLYGTNTLGEHHAYGSYGQRIPYRSWFVGPVPDLRISMPEEPAVVILSVRLEAPGGIVLHRNFTSFIAEGEPPEGGTLSDSRPFMAVRLPAAGISDSRWSHKQWTVLDGRKLNGTGSGFFEYRFPWPSGLDLRDVIGAFFIVEASAKRLNGKDRGATTGSEGDYMRGGGFHDRSRNPNSYPMTSEQKYPSAVTVRANGSIAGTVELEDDPADSRGILSWHAQPRDGHLYEAGSYGQLIRLPLPLESIADASKTGWIIMRLEVSDSLPGGLALYGAQFGRFPVDPTIILVLEKP